MPELKPCPFCGAKNPMITTEECGRYSGMPLYRTKIQCQECEIITRPYYDDGIRTGPGWVEAGLRQSRENAIAAWNRRDCISGTRFRIFAEIDAERKRQHEEWGEQNHPMLLNGIISDINPPICVIKRLAEIAKRKGSLSKKLSWFNILMEEVYETFAETDPKKQREEMVQVAAVAVQIIEYLDRKEEAGE